MPAHPFVTALAGIAVPGAGHFLAGQPRKAAVFFAVLVFMFVAGLGFGGELFPLQMDDPLVFLAALAQWGALLPRLVAGLAGAGQGQVTAISYEYGNTFLIVCGLLNTLVVLNAVDLARGVKR
jgi:hypothetical protein